MSVQWYVSHVRKFGRSQSLNGHVAYVVQTLKLTRSTGVANDLPHRKLGLTVHLAETIIEWWQTSGSTVI